MKWSLFALFVVSLFFQAAAVEVERGTFVLHNVLKPTGRETYEIVRDQDGLVLKSEFAYTDRLTRVPLKASLRLRGDLTPERFLIKGKTAPPTQIDTEIEIEGKSATIREGEHSRQAAVPEHFFTVGGYAPVAVQMLLVRYWSRHGRGESLATLPCGGVRIEHRGRETVEVNGRRVELDRYGIDGVIWGREIVWFDAEERLVAAITVDAEFNRFEAIREGYEPALPYFVARAGEDGMAALAELADRLSPKRVGTLAIVGGTLIDGTDRPPVEDAVVVIAEGRITAAGARSRVTIPDRATILDAHGRSILAGLWDMHAHFCQVEWGPIYLAAGATTVRDCGNEREFAVAVRDAIAAGRGLGPRLLLAGFVDGKGPGSMGVVLATTPGEARAVVRRYNDAGFVQIKVYNSLRPELVPVLAEEAHRLGMSLTGHLPGGMDLEKGVEAGMDQINHIVMITRAMRPAKPLPTPEQPTPLGRSKADLGVDVGSDRARQVVRFLKDHGTVIDPTIALYELLVRPTDRPLAAIEPGIALVAPELSGSLNSMGVPPEQSEIATAVFQKQMEVLAALIKAGVPIVAGTDQGVPGHSLHRELELYVKAGMTPMEAIRSATIVPARVMKRDEELGTVEVGKRADLIVVEGRPDRAISDIRKVRSVVTGGRVFDCAELWKCVGFRP
jgi:imidazolonepropionase-like amidohydrolase